MYSRLNRNGQLPVTVKYILLGHSTESQKPLLRPYSAPEFGTLSTSQVTGLRNVTTCPDPLA